LITKITFREEYTHDGFGKDIRLEIKVAELRLNMCPIPKAQTKKEREEINK